MSCKNCPNRQTHIPKTYRIVSVRRETDMVQSLTFDVSLGAKPGQFVMLWIPGVDEIPMSVAYDDGKSLRVTFFAIGDATRELAKRKEGDLVGLRGPFGTFYEWEKESHLILVAGGYGAAPMYFSAKQAVKDGCKLDVIVGARSKDHLLYLDEFKKLKNTNLHIATDDGSMGHKGYNVEILEKLLAAIPNHGGGRQSDRRQESLRYVSVFACGPERMLLAVSEITAKHKIPSQLSLERYMKCGYGLCGNCTVDPLGIRLCVEGPVVNNDTCRKISEFGKYHRDELGKKHEI